MQVEPATVWLKEEFGTHVFFPKNDGTFNIQPIAALSGSLKVEGAPCDDIPRAQNQTPQHLAQTMVVCLPHHHLHLYSGRLLHTDDPEGSQ